MPFATPSLPGLRERYFDEAAMKRYAEAASQPKEVRWYDTGHDLNDPRALADRAMWLGPKMGLAPVPPILEGRIAREAGNRAAQAPVEPIRVYVTAPAPEGAAPDAALLDSRSNLLKALHGKEGLLLVESPEGADVELRLLRRLRERSRNVTFLSTGTAGLSPVRLKDRVVVGSLVVGDEA